MDLIYNFHTHTFRCGHAIGTEEEYVINAIKCGIKKMGFADHFPLKFEDGSQNPARVKVEEVHLYRDEVFRLKEKYKNDIEIFLGFEMEYYSELFDEMLKNAKSYGAEYLILGQHFYMPENKGGSHVYSSQNEEGLKKYVDSVIEAIKKDVFTYVAHPDMINFSGDMDVYKREMKRLCIGAKETDTPLEINFLGIRDKRIYPNENFWRIAGEIGVKAVFGLDAHDPLGACDVASLSIGQKIAEKNSIEVIEPKLKFL